MLRIGDFSKLGNVTIKALRHYAELGILLPAWIDRYTGYRYYTLEQLPRLNRILALKDLGLSLEQVRHILDNQLTTEELRGMLYLKQAELLQKLREEQLRLARVEAHLGQIEHPGYPDLEAVVLRSVSPITVAYQLITVPNLEKLPEARSTAMREIEACLHKRSISPCGPWILIYTRDEYLEQDIPVEVAVDIGQVPELFQPWDGRVKTRTLPAIQQAAIFAHTGSMETLSEAYTTLYMWIEANGYRTTGPALEIILTDTNVHPELSLEAFSGRKPAGSTLQAVEVVLPVEPILLPDQIEEVAMEPEIIEYRELLVAGTLYEGDNKNQEIADMWAQKFNPKAWMIHNADSTRAYGVCEMDSNLPEGSFRYVAAFEIAKPEDAPPEFYQMRVPGGKYAVFKHVGPLVGLPKTYEYIYQVWLPKSGYRRSERPDLEVYTDEFQDFGPDSVLYLYVPVE